MKKRISIIVAFMLFMGIGYAQTIKWLIEPKYASITHYSDDIFKCIEQNGNLKLVDWNGNLLLPDNIVADAITEYADGYAIVLQGDKILGFLAKSNHNFQPVSGDYHTTEYPFFSEGFLVVADGKGKLGYMDAQGKIAIDCKFEKARPFRKGRASVEPAKKQVYYINSQGKTNNPDSFHGGKLTKGSSFNENGEAVVANYQDYAIIGTNMKVIRKINYTSDLPVRQCDFAYSEGSEDCPESVAMVVMNSDPNVTPYKEGGAYGYKWESEMNDTNIPAQFSEAQPFYANRAIVAKGGKYGVLQLLYGMFEPNWPSKNIRVYPDGMDEVQFALVAPFSLDNSKVKLEFDKGDGSYVDCNSLNYSFKVAEQVISREDGKCKLQAKATYSEDGNDLLLWKGKQEVDIDYISIDLSSPSVTSEYADENDNQTVKAIITNTSDITVKVSAMLTVAGKTTPFNGELKQNQSQTLRVTVKVDDDKQVKATVSAKVDKHDCGSNSSYVTLKKI